MLSIDSVPLDRPSTSICNLEIARHIGGRFFLADHELSRLTFKCVIIPCMRIAMLSCGIALLVGCSSALDTGYVPNKLNASPGERRAYYAPAYSPESQVKSDHDDEISSRRPRPGY